MTILPPILVMTMVNKVMQFHSVSTLILLSSIMIVVWVYKTFLGYARRAIIAVVGARLDTKPNLHLFGRLLRLPLDYFRAAPGRRDDVPGRAGLPGPRVLDGPVIGDISETLTSSSFPAGKRMKEPQCCSSNRLPGESRDPSFCRTSISFLVSRTIALDVREHGTMGPGFRRDGNGGIVRHWPEPVLGPAAGRTWGPVRREGEHQYHLGRSTENIRSVISVSPW